MPGVSVQTQDADQDIEALCHQSLLSQREFLGLPASSSS
jgi:hypothetical protein